jgi:type I restriction enzyme S subunit
MNAGWQTLPLEACMATIIDYRGKSPTKTTFGVPLVTAKIIKGGRIERPEEFIAETDFDVWMRRGMPKAGDIVMTTEAPLGEVAQLDGRKIALAQRVITLRGKPDVLDNTFLKFLLQSHPVQEELRSRGTGTTVVGIRQSELRKVNLTFPPLAEQKAIATVLGTLDDKIELNRQMNATLEAMARALFQSWFVDFDPVRAKLDGQQAPGLDTTTAAVFPSEFEGSELGHIPKGWTVQRLPDAVEVNPRRTLKAGVVAPYLDMKNLPTQGHSAEEVIDREFSSGTKFQNGDTLLARITPCLENGKTGYVDFLEDEQVGWGSTEYIVLAPKPPLPPQFGYLLARSDALRAHAIQNMTGTSGRQRVPSECFNNFLLAVPTPEVARRFDELTAPLMTKIKANAQESRTIATLRDALLPKLLSGEIPISHTDPR